MTEPTTTAGRIVWDRYITGQLVIPADIARIEMEARDEGRDEAARGMSASIVMAERLRIAAIIREHEDEWDTTYSSVPGISLAAVLALLEEQP